jgi:hypothetical protein
MDAKMDSIYGCKDGFKVTTRGSGAWTHQQTMYPMHACAGWHTLRAAATTASTSSTYPRVFETNTRDTSLVRGPTREWKCCTPME